MVFPWIQFLGKKGKLSDIEYLAIKEFDGKLRSAEGTLSAAGDLATLTANGGKDMYIASAKVTFFANADGAESTADEVVLKLNGTIIETAKWSLDDSGAVSGGVLAFTYEFKNIGQKVAATQIIKLEVITLDAEVDVEGFIEVFEEDTGASPAV